jgi:putative antirepressor
MRKENNNNNNILKVIDEREVLGKQFRIYGDFENPLFLAKDVAEFIDYSKNGSGVRDVSKMVSVVDNEEKLKRTMFVSGQNREVIMLTEDGLYEVLMQSRKPIAKQFKKKVKEILKDIRRYGMYAKDEILNNPDFLLAVAEKLRQEKQEKLMLKYEVKSLKDTNKQLKKNTKQLTETIQEQEPLVELSKTLLKAKNTITFGCMAKMLKTNGVDIGRNRLTKFLKEQKVLTQEVTPYQEYMNKGYFEVYQTIIGGKTIVGTRITPQGQLLIVKLIMDKYNK